jgi:hypothetical protein
MILMLLALACVLFAIGYYFYLRTWRVIREMVRACRADDPSRRFSRHWWWPAWRHYKRRFPEGDLRKRIVLSFALSWVWMGSAFALIVFLHLHGHLLR